jgi:DNA-binding transcriptional regulator YhcF (GntR family)
MMTVEGIEAIISQNLGLEISKFNLDFILSIPTATEESVRQVYDMLKGHNLTDDKITTHAHLLGINPETIERNYSNLSRLGLSDEKIATNAALLGMNPETIERNYSNLSRLGLSDEKIASQAHFLGMNPETIERNYSNLSRLGLSDEKIASRAELLGMNPKTIEGNYSNLSRLGLSDEKIASRAELLGRDPETIERNYQNLIGLLRQDYNDRNSGRGFILTNAQLLGNNPTTLESNIQYLSLHGISPTGLLMGTTPQNKRKKVAYLLRELFDFGNLQQAEKRQTVEQVYDLVREKPQLMIDSIKTLERKLPQLREQLVQYQR